MPKSKSDNSYRSWSREECFAHNKNTMAERFLQHTLETLGRERFHSHAKKKLTITEVRDTLHPLSLTTGYLNHTDKLQLLQRHYATERKVTFDEDSCYPAPSAAAAAAGDGGDDERQVVCNGHDATDHHKIAEKTSKTLNVKKPNRGQDSVGKSHAGPIQCKQSSKNYNIGNTSTRCGIIAERQVKSSVAKREKLEGIPDPHSRPFSCPAMGRPESEPENGRQLSLLQISRINQYYLNRMKHKRRYRQSGYSSGSKGLMDIVEINDANERDPRETNEKKEMGNQDIIYPERKLNPNSKWSLVTVQKLLHLRDESNTNDPDAALLKSRQLVQMPKLYQVYWSNIERFREMAAMAAKQRQRRKSDVSTIGTDVDSLGAAGCASSQVDPADTDSGSESESLGFRDEVDKRLWRDDKDPEKNGKKRYKEKGEKVTAKTEDHQSHHLQEARKSDVCNASQEDGDDRTCPESFYPTPISSLSRQSSMKNNNQFESNTQDQYPSNKRQVSFLRHNNSIRSTGGAGRRDESFSVNQSKRRTDTSRINSRHDGYGESDEAAATAVPLAQFVRAVESGLSVESFIHRVADLRVPLSRVIVRREREKMVRSHTPRTVRSDKEKERMREIQGKIHSFLLTLPLK